MAGEAGVSPEALEAAGPAKTASEDAGEAVAVGKAGDAEAPDGVGEDVVGARVAARPTA